ncbi:MAG: serine/threonine protein kinase [Deltaproteobacteria bacterium]|nr:serine/threonine protein kinase [Deltaproteobacteria bacterium]
MSRFDAGPDGPVTGDTEICAFHALESVIAMLANTRRLLALEVGALVGMELCERALEGNAIGTHAVQIDVIGHLRVTRAIRPDDGGLLETLNAWERAIHPRGREQFRRALRDTPASLQGQDLMLFLRDRFAGLLYPIDRVSARTSLAGAIELASREAALLDTGKRERVDPDAPDFDDLSTSRGIGPASVEHILSGLDDSVFMNAETRLRVEAYGGPGAPDFADLTTDEVTSEEPHSLEVALLGPSPSEAPVRQVGQFEIFGRLGEGGMAEALLARHVDGGAPFVLKRLLPEAAADPSLLRMFEDEARLGLFLDHEHIARVLEYVPGPQPLMKMEWAPGLTLAKLMKRSREASTPIPLDVILRVGDAVSSALAYAHGARGMDGRPLRVVHRDVSPQNVVLQWDGHIKLLDFGVARSAVQAEHSEAGVIKGKFAYMAPEQSLGMPLDDRADVFCVGICLYEALSGKRLFDSDERLAAVRALAEGPIPDIRRHRPEVSEELATLVRRCLASDPKNRPHMDELHDELQALRRRHRARRQSVVDIVRTYEPGWEDWRRALSPTDRPTMAPPGPARERGKRTEEGLRPIQPRGPSLWTRMWPALLLIASFVVGAATYALIRSATAPDPVPDVPAPVESSPVSMPASVTDSDSDSDDREPTAEADSESRAPTADHREPTAEADSESRAPTAEAEDATGTLLIRTHPRGARVTLDGVRLRGRTPERWTIPAGPHRVQIFRVGHRPETRHIVTEPDSGGMLDIRLRRR